MNKWKESGPDPMTWGEASEYENPFTRLPTLSELEEAYSKGIDGFKPEIYWTGESKENDKYNAWVFDLKSGQKYYLVKSYKCYMRLIKR